jgi:cytochrome c biogenesis protein ResB
MKTKLYNLMAKAGVLCAVVLATACVSVQAQSLQYRIRVNIPFDFSIANKKLPAGNYSIGRAIQNSDNTVLSILDGRGHTKEARLSIPVLAAEAKNQATLVFHRYGDEYFLYQVWTAGETTGRQFLKSSAERALQSQGMTNQSSGKATPKMTVATVTAAGVLQ